MARQTQASTAPPPSGTILSLPELHRAKTINPELKNRIWEPIPCVKCEGSGTVDGEPCVRCLGTGDGPQGWVLKAPQFEIFNGGAKGGAKTAVGIAFLIAGNRDQPNLLPDGSFNYVNTPDGTPTLVNLSYVYHPYYRGLILRQNREDLDDWIEHAKRMYSFLGGEYKAGAFQFQFPSGAKIVCGHLKDDYAYEKYTGVETHRIVIEEVNQIPSLSLYLDIRSCCRSVYPEIKPQILTNGNPVGPGLNWVKDRFIKPLVNGEVVQPRTQIDEEVRNPFTGEVRKISRIFIPAWLSDNPYLLKDENYVLNLATLDEKKRRAYLDGDWDAYGGNYFGDVFRTRHLSGEPDNACHVIPAGSRKLAPWWRRSMSGDWGYAHESAFLWMCECADDDTLDIYREWGASQSNPEEIGFEIARLTLPDLQASETGTITLYFSHDAFSRKTERSYVELLAQGIGRVLGPNMVHIPELEVEVLQESYRSGVTDYTTQQFKQKFDKILAQRRLGITIRRAARDRIIGWQHCRSLLRWKPLTDPSGKVDWDAARRIASEYGMERYVDYVNQFANQRRETLPKLRIEDCCPRLIDAIGKAVSDDVNQEDVSKTHFHGMDHLDAWRYLAMGYRSAKVQEPYKSFLDHKLTDAAAHNPDYTTQDLVWVNRFAEQEWKEKRQMPDNQRVARVRRSGYASPRQLPISRLLM